VALWDSNRLALIAQGAVVGLRCRSGTRRTSERGVNSKARIWGGWWRLVSRRSLAPRHAMPVPCRPRPRSASLIPAQRVFKKGSSALRPAPLVRRAPAPPRWRAAARASSQPAAAWPPSSGPPPCTGGAGQGASGRRAVGQLRGRSESGRREG
jgi:hypothetical protein